jgi:predicted dithiol-disulfide oxidoreductase (DUF899 family)
MNKLRDVSVVSRADWLVARKSLLAKEKASSRERDALSAERRKLPMVKIDAPYAFDAPAGRRTLRELFGPHPSDVPSPDEFGWRRSCDYAALLEPSTDRGSSSAS